MAVSLALKLAGKSHMALFIGRWAAPFLLLASATRSSKSPATAKRNSRHNAIPVTTYGYTITNAHLTDGTRICVHYILFFCLASITGN